MRTYLSLIAAIMFLLGCARPPSEELPYSLDGRFGTPCNSNSGSGADDEPFCEISAVRLAANLERYHGVRIGVVGILDRWDGQNYLQIMGRRENFTPRVALVVFGDIGNLAGVSVKLVGEFDAVTPLSGNFIGSLKNISDIMLAVDELGVQDEYNPVGRNGQRKSEE